MISRQYNIYNTDREILYLLLNQKGSNDDKTCVNSVQTYVQTINNRIETNASMEELVRVMLKMHEGCYNTEAGNLMAPCKTYPVVAALEDKQFFFTFRHPVAVDSITIVCTGDTQESNICAHIKVWSGELSDYEGVIFRGSAKYSGSFERDFTTANLWTFTVSISKHIFLYNQDVRPAMHWVIHINLKNPQLMMSSVNVRVSSSAIVRICEITAVENNDFGCHSKLTLPITDGAQNSLADTCALAGNVAIAQMLLYDSYIQLYTVIWQLAQDGIKWKKVARTGRVDQFKIALEDNGGELIPFTSGNILFVIRFRNKRR